MTGPNQPTKSDSPRPPNANTEFISVDLLSPLDGNPRKISRDKMKKLKESIKKNKSYFWARPCLVNDASGDLVVYAGNQRLRAAIDLGQKEVPCIVETLTKDEQDERMVRDNIELGEWDIELLKKWDPIKLQDWGVASEFLNIRDKKGKTDEDVAPTPPIVAKAKLGDIYQLGEHRLMCGDATSQDDIKKLMAGAKVDLIFTDPPYNVDYSGSGEKTSEKIKNDNLSESDFAEFLKKSFDNYAAVADKHTAIYVFHAHKSQAAFGKAITDAGFDIRSQLIWNKPNLSLGWGDYQWKHEPFFYGGVEGGTPQFFGDRKNTTTWDFKMTDEQILKKIKVFREAEKEGMTTIWTMKRDFVGGYIHPTQKPVELIKKAIKNSSLHQQSVADFFAGSGSTLIACEATHRRCFALEFNPKYIDAIIERWENFTGAIAEKII